MFSRVHRGLLVFGILFLISHIGDLPEHAADQQILPELIEAAVHDGVEEEHINDAIVTGTGAAVNVRRLYILCGGGQWANLENSQFHDG